MHLAEKPLVTVGIPTYCRLSYLKEAVASALAQTYRPLEIRIHQNPHTDVTVTRAIQNWAQEMADRHPEVHFTLHEANIGSCANFNSLVDQARGRYIMVLGDDDRLVPDALEKLVAALEEDVDVCFGNLHVIDQQGKRLPEHTEAINRERRRLPAGKLSAIEAQIAAWKVLIPIFGSLIRTDVFRRFRFREDLLLTDTEFFIRLAHAGVSFKYIAEFVSEVRYHPYRISSSLTHFERLAKALSAVDVAPPVKPYKRAALKATFSNAITQQLLQGNRARARSYYFHAANPTVQRFSPKGLFQGLCLMLPGGHHVFRWLHRLHNPAYYRQEGERWGEEALAPEEREMSAELSSVLT